MFRVEMGEADVLSVLSAGLSGGEACFTGSP